MHGWRKESQLSPRSRPNRLLASLAQHPFNCLAPFLQRLDGHSSTFFPFPRGPLLPPRGALLCPLQCTPSCRSTPSFFYSISCQFGFSYSLAILLSQGVLLQEASGGIWRSGPHAPCADALNDVITLPHTRPQSAACVLKGTVFLLLSIFNGDCLGMLLRVSRKGSLSQ